MRSNHIIVKEGKLIYLNDNDNIIRVHPGIFTFERKTPEEIGRFSVAEIKELIFVGKN